MYYKFFNIFMPLHTKSRQQHSLRGQQLHTFDHILDDTDTKLFSKSSDNVLLSTDNWCYQSNNVLMKQDNSDKEKHFYYKEAVCIKHLL